MRLTRVSVILGCVALSDEGKTGCVHSAVITATSAHNEMDEKTRG